MGKTVGIDLGTTFSLIAVIEGGEPIVFPTAEGGRLLPSVVAMTKTDERIVGWLAKRQAMLNLENTIYSIKRLMGTRFKDASVKNARKRLPYKITEAANGDVRVTMRGRIYSPPEISAMILYRLKIDAEKYLGEEVTDAVITVPAYFNDNQRQATKDAGTIAGLNVLRIINEPTAASLAYGMHKEHGMTIAVYDFGGGTFDISILEIGEKDFRVKSTNGDTHLGGDDLDDRIVDWMCDEFMKENRIDLRRDNVALQRVRDAAEKAKHDLSSLEQTEVNLPFIATDDHGPKHLVIPVTRAKLESLVSDLIKKTIDCCRQALANARLSPSQINEVLLVGGSTRIPKVQVEVLRFFGKEPRKGIDPDEAIAMGAAVYAGMLSGQVEKTTLMDITPLTLGMRTVGGEATPIIPRNSAIPNRRSQIFKTVADYQHLMDIQVYQGEHRMFDDNEMLGKFTFHGIPEKPAGEAKIEVTFSIDEDGLISVDARDLATANEQKMTISASSGLTKEEVRQLALDFQARHNAEAVVERAGRLVQYSGDQVTAELVEEIEGSIASTKSALAGEDMFEISRDTKMLSELLERAGGGTSEQKVMPVSAGQQSGFKPE